MSRNAKTCQYANCLETSERGIAITLRTPTDDGDKKAEFCCVSHAVAENSAQIERTIGQAPGDPSFIVDDDNIAKVRDWLTSQGISRDRANACRRSTLERVYRNPAELRKFLWRGDYNGGTNDDNQVNASPPNPGLRGDNPRDMGARRDTTGSVTGIETTRPMANRGTETTGRINGVEPCNTQSSPSSPRTGLKSPSTIASSPSAPQPTPLNGQGYSGKPETLRTGPMIASGSLTDVIAGIACGDYDDEDVSRLRDICNAHLGE